MHDSPMQTGGPNGVRSSDWLGDTGSQNSELIGNPRYVIRTAPRRRLDPSAVR
jgi:hypothetical protein